IATSNQVPEKAPLAAVKGAAASTVTESSSVLQQAGIVDRSRPAGTEHGDDDRKPDDHFGGRHNHDEERHDLAVQVAVDARERDESEVACVEHEFDAHEHHDGVTAQEHTECPDREQDRGQVEVVRRAHDCLFPDGGPPSSAGCGLRPRSRRNSSTAGGTLNSDGLPSGSNAGVSTALCRAYTPGPGNGVGCVPTLNRSRICSRWPSLGSCGSRCASTIAPRAAVISKALVTSKAKM